MTLRRGSGASAAGNTALVSRRRPREGVPAATDPLDDLAVAACNLMAEALDAHCCGVIAIRDAHLRAASSALLALPASQKDDLVSAVVAAICDAADMRSSRLVEVAAPPEISGCVLALLFPETESVVFQVLPPGRKGDGGAFRRAAAAALAALSRMDDLRIERRRLLETNRLLGRVEELSEAGGWELWPGTGRLLWSDEAYLIHGLEPGGAMTLERMLQLYSSPGRERLGLEMDRAAGGGAGFDITLPLGTQADDRRVVRVVARSSDRSSGRLLYGIVQDVTAAMASGRRVWWAANHDPITSLPNRLLFEDRLASAVERARRDGRGFALVVIEISDFARLGRHSGYAMPDRRMLDIASRLGLISRGSDTVARISLNEFAVIVSDVASADDLVSPLSRMKREVDGMRREGNGDPIAVSAGVAVFPEHADGPEQILRAAEIALSRARQEPDEPVVVFQAQITGEDPRRRETVRGLARSGLGRGEFVPYYQPQVDIETGEVVGAEALVRWRTSEFLLDAKDFAHALEDHEVGSLVGRAMLDAVIADLARLRKTTPRPFRISVNASRTQVLRNDFLETFLEKTQSRDLDPADFVIEITEDVILGVDDQALHDRISFLASSGVDFSLDDFGTGYASLIHVASFPIKQLKIDKQFILGIDADGRKRAIVRGIVRMAHSMGLNVIAEGVETPEQQEVLRAIGCRHAQGYLYAVPLPYAEFADMLRAPGEAEGGVSARRASEGR